MWKGAFIWRKTMVEDRNLHFNAANFSAILPSSAWVLKICQCSKKKIDRRF
jgi:hypothetical protein